MKINTPLILIVFFCLTACTSKQQENNGSAFDEAAVLDKNKNIVNNVFKELINERNLSAIDELYAKDMVDHSPFEGDSPGIGGFRKSVKDFIAMYPDLKVNIEDIIASGDKVATRESWKGTHFITKKVATGETMHIFRITDGKVTDEWSMGWDWLPNP